MKSSENFAPVSQFGVLIEGEPKTGKTTLGLLFPDVYVVDCNNNLGGAVRMLNELQPGKKFHYDSVSVDDKGNEVEIKDRWTRVTELCKAAVKVPEIKTIMIDTAGDLDIFLQAHIVSKKTEGDKTKMTIGDWVPYKDMFARFIMAMRSTPKMLVMTSHLVAEKDEVTGVMKYKPAISGKLQESFGGYFSDVWLTQVEKIGEKYNYFVKTKSAGGQHIGVGNSLGLPENYKFAWDEFAKILYSSKSYVAPKPTTNPLLK